MSIQQPLVSCIILAFNHENSVATAIHSVLQQTHENTEIIVVDDGSSDNTLVICQRLQRIHGFKLLTHPNQGVVKSINRALKEVSGEYIAMCASDDFWLPKKTELQVAYMQRNPGVGLVHSNCIQLYETKNRVSLHHAPADNFQNYSTTDFLLNNLLCPLTFMIRKQSLDKMGGLDERVPHEDFQLGWHFITHGLCAYLPEVVAIRTIHGSNLSRNHERMLNALWATFQYVIPENEKQSIEPYFNLKELKLLSRIDRMKAIRCIPKSLKLSYTPEFWAIVARIFGLRL